MKKFVPVPAPKVKFIKPPEEIFEKKKDENVVLEVKPSETEKEVLATISPKVEKKKKPRSQKQLDHLKRIREKSLKARQAKAALKKAENTPAPPPPLTNPCESPQPETREIPPQQRVSYVSAPPTRTIIAEPQQVITAPKPIEQNYLSAEQIQNIVRDTMTTTLNDYSKQVATANASRAEEVTARHKKLAEEEVALNQKKMVDTLLRRPKKMGGRF